MVKYTVCVLQEGYCSTPEEDRFSAGCSITLLKGEKSNVLVDCGGPQDSKLIVDGLSKHGLTPGDITHMIGSHGHSDHIGNLNLFPDAICIVSHNICTGNEYVMHDFKEPYMIDDGLSVFSSPGHSGSDISVLLSDSSFGKLAVVGDLFECEADVENADFWSVISENPKVQAENRCKVIDMADYIIPGHGKGFAVTERIRQLCHQQRKAILEA